MPKAAALTALLLAALPGVCRAQDQSRAILLPFTSVVRHLRAIPLPQSLDILALSPDGKTIAGSSWDSKKGRVVLWDSTDGRELWTLAKIHSSCLAFSPDGKTLAGCPDKDQVVLWDVATGKSRRLWEGPWAEFRTGSDFQPIGHTNVEALAFSPDGKTLAACRLSPEKQENLLMVLDVETGRVLQDLYTGGNKRIMGVPFSPDGKALAAAANDGGILIFDPASGSRLTESYLNYDYENIVKTDWPRWAGFSPDGKTLFGVVSNDGVDLVDFTGNLRQVGKRIKTGMMAFVGTPGVAFYPGSDLLAFPAYTYPAQQNQIQLMDLASGATVAITAPVDDAAYLGEQLAFSAEGRTLAALSRRAGNSRAVFLWDVSELAAFRKDPFESSAQYQARLADWKRPYSAPITLSDYDADQGAFKAVLAGSLVLIPVPGEQARTIAVNKRPMLVQGTLRYADALKLRLAGASLVDPQTQDKFVLEKAVAGAAPALAPKPAPAPVEDLDAVPDFKSAPQPDDLAVVIGVESYQSVPRSDYSDADARLVKAYLQALGIPERNIEFLVDSRATKSALEKTFEAWLPNHVKKGSRVVVYYSGHGAPEPASGDAYLVPFDGDPNYLANTGFPLKRLYADLGRLDVRQVVVVLDACFSGAGGRSVLAKGARPLVTVSDAGQLPFNVAVLSAAQGSQISTSSPRVHLFLSQGTQGRQEGFSGHLCGFGAQGRRRGQAAQRPADPGAKA
jgi:WD40 repeat protein